MPATVLQRLWQQLKRDSGDPVIASASEVIQSQEARLDCFVAEPALGLAVGETRGLPRKKVGRVPIS
jgi:hypothetical protein